MWSLSKLDPMFPEFGAEVWEKTRGTTIGAESGQRCGLSCKFRQEPCVEIPWNGRLLSSTRPGAFLMNLGNSATHAEHLLCI